MEYDRGKKTRELTPITFFCYDPRKFFTLGREDKKKFMSGSDTIEIHISLDVASPPEPTGPADYITLVCLCAITIAEICFCLYLYRRSFTYFPLRSNAN